MFANTNNVSQEAALTLDFKLPYLHQKSLHDGHHHGESTLGYDVKDKGRGEANDPVFESRDYQGKVIYLDFWASWCTPCALSMPLLNKLRNKYVSRGFEVIAINVDEDVHSALSFMDKMTVDYPVLYDIKGVVAKKYHINNLPSGLLFNAQGKLILEHEGFKKSDISFLNAVVDKEMPSD